MNSVGQVAKHFQMGVIVSQKLQIKNRNTDLSDFFATFSFQSAYKFSKTRNQKGKGPIRNHIFLNCQEKPSKTITLIFL